MSSYLKTVQEFAHKVKQPASLSSMPFDQDKSELYHSLVVGSISSVISPCFPVLTSILSEQQWQIIVKEFLTKYQHDTYLYNRLAYDMVKFLQQHNITEYPFSAELAHYEWIELEISLIDEQPENMPDLSNSLLTTSFQLSNLARILNYQYDVENICQEYIPSKPLSSYLIVYKLNNAINFSKISEINFQILTYMLNQQVTSQEVIQALCAMHGSIDKNILQNQVEEMLHKLLVKKIIIGDCYA